MRTVQEIAKRFRPFLKFSTDGGKREPHRPINLEWFDGREKSGQDVRKVLRENDLRDGKGRQKGTKLIVSDDHKLGPEFGTAPIYCHASRIGAHVNGRIAGTTVRPTDPVLGSDLLNLEYWLLFAFNQGTRGVAFEHEGDILGVQLVYDATADAITRVCFSEHGSVLHLFELTGSAAPKRVRLHGKSLIGQPEAKECLQYAVNPEHSFRGGTYLAEKAARQVLFVRDDDSREYSHVAMFLEWGAHEPWPNTTGDVSGAPKHGGDDISFVPPSCKVLDRHDQDDAALMFYSGQFGGTPGLALHGMWLPDAEMDPLVRNTDRDDASPYEQHGVVHWPPERQGVALAIRVHLQDTGNATFPNCEIAGAPGSGRRLEGFKIEVALPTTPALELEYCAIGPGSTSPPTYEPLGGFVGSEGQSRPLVGFRIRLKGSSAAHYEVDYRAYLHGGTQTPLCRNDDYCGAEDPARWLEAIWVRVRRRLAG